MAGRRKSVVVDGYTALKAVREARQREAPPEQTEAVGGESAGTAAGKRGGIGHTVLPTKHHVACYHCNYGLTLSGRIVDTVCPKCRKRLSARDAVIQGDWAEELLTIGTVRIAEDGRVHGGRLHAQELVVAGRVEEGEVSSGGRLTVAAGGQIDPRLVAATELLIEFGAEVRCDGELACARIEVAGVLKGVIRTRGRVWVRTGGCLRGTFTGSHIVLDEGGGLIARVHLMADEP